MGATIKFELPEEYSDEIVHEEEFEEEPTLEFMWRHKFALGILVVLVFLAVVALAYFFNRQSGTQAVSAQRNPQKSAVSIGLPEVAPDKNPLGGQSQGFQGLMGVGGEPNRIDAGGAGRVVVKLTPATQTPAATSPTVVVFPTVEVASTPEATATETPVPTDTLAPTNTPVPTATSTPTVTPTPTNTRTTKGLDILQGLKELVAPKVTSTPARIKAEEGAGPVAPEPCYIRDNLDKKVLIGGSVVTKKSPSGDTPTGETQNCQFLTLQEGWEGTVLAQLAVPGAGFAYEVLFGGASSTLWVSEYYLEIK